MTGLCRNEKLWTLEIFFQQTQTMKNIIYLILNDRRKNFKKNMCLFLHKKINKLNYQTLKMIIKFEMKNYCTHLHKVLYALQQHSIHDCSLPMPKALEKNLLFLFAIHVHHLTTRDWKVSSVPLFQHQKHTILCWLCAVQVSRRGGRLPPSLSRWSRARLTVIGYTEDQHYAPPGQRSLFIVSERLS